MTDAQAYGEEEIYPAIFAHVIVQSRISHNLRLEPRKREGNHPRESLYAGRDFESHLVFEEPWMAHHLVVEDEVVGECCRANSLLSSRKC